MRPGRTGPPVRDQLEFPVAVCPVCFILGKREPCVLSRCPRKTVEVRDVAELREVCAKGKR
jgi:hypothetical protein